MRIKIKKIVPKLLFGLSLFLIAFSIFNWNAHPKPFQDGDIIFQASKSSQSNAIFAASLSAYTHMGIIKNTKNGMVVIEAVGPVKETPIREWINRGRFDRYAIYRLKNNKDIAFEPVFNELKKYYGRPYDLFFSFNNRAIYCSELVNIGYSELDIHLGQPQKVSSLWVNLPIVKSLIYRRAKKDPECIGKTKSECKNIIANRELITPVAIARDKRLFKVYSNYPL